MHSLTIQPRTVVTNISPADIYIDRYRNEW